MPSGDIFPPECRTFNDPWTGVPIRQLTNWRAHSHHLYFTNSGFWDGGRRLLIVSDRRNAGNFYSVELDGGEITQLTDFAADEQPGLLSAFLNPVRDEAYFIVTPDVWAVDLRTFKQRKLWTAPAGYRNGNLSCTADGKTVCHVVQQDLSDRIHMDLGHGYVGFAEYSAARPHCRIVAIDVDGGPAQTLYEEDFWLGHINTSPALADVLTFCHEGPWQTIDQRMWTLEIATGTARPLRPQKPKETIGHEYWFADGRRLGYHGTHADGTHIFGTIAADGTGCREFPFPHGSSHFHSLDETLIAGDGYHDQPHLLLWRLAGDGYDGPRRLLTHRGSWHIQNIHVHPRMFTDRAGGRQIVYTADPQGYGNVYLVEIPDFASLPAYAGKQE